MFLQLLFYVFLFANLSYTSDSEGYARFINGTIKSGYCSLHDGSNIKSSRSTVEGVTVSNFEVKNKKLISCKIESGTLNYEGQDYGPGFVFKNNEWYLDKEHRKNSNDDNGIIFRVGNQLNIIRNTYDDTDEDVKSNIKEYKIFNYKTKKVEDSDDDSDTDTDTDEDIRKKDKKQSVINIQKLPTNKIIENNLPGIGVVTRDGKRMKSNLEIGSNGSITTSFISTKIDPETGDVVSYQGGKEIRRIKKNN